MYLLYIQVKMQSVSDDEVRKRLVEKPRFQLIVLRSLVFVLYNVYLFFDFNLFSITILVK